MHHCLARSQLNKQRKQCLSGKVNPMHVLTDIARRSGMVAAMRAYDAGINAPIFVDTNKSMVPYRFRATMAQARETSACARITAPCEIRVS